ncbi:MAG: FAD-dependent oxidoreductase [Candidatus Aureabacteria bacterium]|nr:FAD-dependent oxidoreductase [Candidatus Auribacterota bacterium]
MRKNANSHYVIIGNSVAGIAALEAIREIDHEHPITIIDREAHEVYSRPLISYFLEGRVDESLMHFRPPDFHKKMKARIRLGTQVTGIDARRKQITLGRDGRLGYEKLLIAVGAEPVTPPIPGLDGPGVHTFTTWDDAIALKRNVKKGARIVVMGAGLIGIKAAEGLKALGARATIVELGDMPFPAVLDNEAGRIVAAHIRKNGVRLILSRRVKEICRKSSSIVSAIVDGGEEIPCSHVLVAVGVRPRLELCRGTGIKTRTGILVDKFMATSVKGIYAAGDVTEALALSGGRKNTPIWPLAYEQGRVAGGNMAGEKKVYKPGTQMNSIEVFGLPLITLGDSASNIRGGEALTFRGRGTPVYKKILLKKNRIAGAIFVGEIERAGIIAGLMLDGTDVTTFREELLKESFGYIYVPRQNRARYIAPIEV